MTTEIVSSPEKSPAPSHKRKAEEDGLFNAFEAGLFNAFEETLVCNVCYDVKNGILNQCTNGHIVCRDCNEKLTKRECPMCKESLPNKIARALIPEQIIRKLLTKCDKCNSIMTRENLVPHTPCRVWHERKLEERYQDRTIFFVGLKGGEKVDHILYTDELNNGTVEFFEDGEHVRSEHKEPHEDVGLTKFVENKKMIREEYKEPHEYAGLTLFFENENIIRKEYKEPHQYAGLTKFVENGKTIREQYKEPHEYAGLTAFFEDNNCRMEYKEPHKEAGFTKFREKGKTIRKEYKEPHKEAGVTEFFENRRMNRKEFKKPHNDTGLTQIYANQMLLREEYRWPHRLKRMTIDFDTMGHII